MKRRRKCSLRTMQVERHPKHEIFYEKENFDCKSDENDDGDGRDDDISKRKIKTTVRKKELNMTTTEIQKSNALMEGDGEEGQKQVNNEKEIKSKQRGERVISPEKDSSPRSKILHSSILRLRKQEQEVLLAISKAEKEITQRAASRRFLSFLGISSVRTLCPISESTFRYICSFRAWSVKKKESLLHKNCIEITTRNIHVRITSRKKNRFLPAHRGSTFHNVPPITHFGRLFELLFENLDSELCQKWNVPAPTSLRRDFMYRVKDMAERIREAPCKERRSETPTCREASSVNGSDDNDRDDHHPYDSLWKYMTESLKIDGEFALVFIALNNFAALTQAGERIADLGKSRGTGAADRITADDTCCFESLSGSDSESCDT